MPGAVSALLATPGAAAALLATVAAIFARELRGGPVGPDEDFFDLGGDSITALAVMAEIGQATGVELPITTIYDAPTPAALAARLARAAAPVQASCLVCMRPGPGRPLFIAHGVGGSVMELRELALRLDTDGPVYGIEARGLDGVAAPLDRVEDMAAFHLDEIRRVQPAGPYRLAGFSFGGLVALEIARRLLAAGETVAFLGLLDTYPHSRFWPWRCRVAAWARLARLALAPATWRRMGGYYGDVLRHLPPGERLAFVAARARRAAAIAFHIFEAGKFLRRFADPSAQPGRGRTASPPAVRRVQCAGERAFAAYRPRAYAGDITLVNALGETMVPFEARLLWGALARHVTVDAVPGDHQGLVRAGVVPLAAVLSAALRRIGDTVPGRA